MTTIPFFFVFFFSFLYFFIYSTFLFPCSLSTRTTRWIVPLRWRWKSERLKQPFVCGGRSDDACWLRVKLHLLIFAPGVELCLVVGAARAPRRRRGLRPRVTAAARSRAPPRRCGQRPCSSLPMQLVFRLGPDVASSLQHALCLTVATYAGAKGSGPICWWSVSKLLFSASPRAACLSHRFPQSFICEVLSLEPIWALFSSKIFWVKCKKNCYFAFWK